MVYAKRKIWKGIITLYKLSSHLYFTGLCEKSTCNADTRGHVDT